MESVNRALFRELANEEDKQVRYREGTLAVRCREDQSVLPLTFMVLVLLFFCLLNAPLIIVSF